MMVRVSDVEPLTIRTHAMPRAIVVKLVIAAVMNLEANKVLRDIGRVCIR